MLAINKYTAIAFVLALFSCACLRERDRSTEIQALIEQTVEERLANYERIRMERCRESILEEATRISDSLLIVEARREKEQMERPPKPTRPDKPEMKKLEDTTALKPLLPSTDSVENADTSRQ